MSRWSEILDAAVSAEEVPPKHIATLRFPKLGGWEPGRVWSEWSVEGDFLTPMGTLFGGYLVALADHAMASALFTMLDDSEVMSTTDLHANFLRPVREGAIRIEATVVNRGRRTAYCEALFRDSSGRLVARAGATQQILSRSEAGSRADARRE